MVWPYADQVTHLVLYTGCGFVFVRAFRPELKGWGRGKIILIAAAGGFFYGMTDEFHQRFVPPRSPELGDLLMDGAGGFWGGVGFLAKNYLHHGRTAKQSS